MSVSDGYFMKEDELGERATAEQNDYLGNSKEENGDGLRSKNQQGTSGGGTKVILITYRDEFEKNEAVGLVEAAGYRVVQLLIRKEIVQRGVWSGHGQSRRTAEGCRRYKVANDRCR